MDFTIKRVKKELMELEKSRELEQCGIHLQTADDSILAMEATISGPPDTPYEGATFRILVKIPPNYPFEPPRVRFLTPIWHPNIGSRTGAVCLDILKEQWSGATLRSVLLSIQAMMGQPEPDDPQDAIVAKQLQEAPELFGLTARHWSFWFAGGPQKVEEFDHKVALMEIMGFKKDEVRLALSATNWNVEDAIGHLLS